MKKIYQNFDGFDVTFQCALPRHILDDLKKAQQEAKDTRKGVYLDLGKSKTQVEVAENGMKGGFAFRFDTGLDGAIWAVADSDHAERWNVKVSAKSLMLALYGYRETKNKILDFLIEELKAIPPENHDTPLERVSRFDFCVDFLADNDFVPDAKCFLTHNRSKKNYQGQIANISPLEHFSIIDQGRDVQTITIGKMPNRQITIYNKRREILVTRKIYWWDLWGINPDEIKSNIWRVEARAGKKELNKWNLRRFSDFEEKAGDVIISLLKDYRYVIPNSDRNRARWSYEPFWKTCISSAKNYLAEYICNAERKEIISGIREEIIRRYQAHINGVLTSYAAVQGLDISEIPTVLEGVNKDVIEAIRKNPQKFKINYEKSEKKFEFLHAK